MGVGEYVPVLIFVFCVFVVLFFVFFQIVCTQTGMRADICVTYKYHKSVPLGAAGWCAASATVRRRGEKPRSNLCLYIIL